MELGFSAVSSNPRSFSEGTSTAGAAFSVTGGGVVFVLSGGGFLGQPTTKSIREAARRLISSLELRLGIHFLHKNSAHQKKGEVPDIHGTFPLICPAIPTGFEGAKL